MKGWKNWQVILAVVTAGLTVLGVLYTAISNYVGTQYRVEDLANQVASLSTPESAKSDMCVTLNEQMAREISNGNTSAYLNLEAQMQKMGCYELAVSVNENAATPPQNRNSQ